MVTDFLKNQRQHLVEAVGTVLDSQTPILAPVNSFGCDAVERLKAYTTSGKMVRGSLVAAGYKIAADPSVPVDWLDAEIPSIARRAGAAIELLQSMLLIHDDIMDQDRYRRGQESMHVQYEEFAARHGLGDSARFGEAAATCIGDIAGFLAIGELSRVAAGHHRLAEIVAIVAGEMAIVGIAQINDVYRGFAPSAGSATADYPAEIDAITDLYRFKTGRYTFSLPLMVGALLAGGTANLVDWLATLGEELGIIFQIRDDMIGVFGDAGEIGKPVGSDITENKKTLVRLLLFRAADDAARERLSTVFGNPAAGPDDIAFVREAVRQSGTEAAVQRFVDDRAARVTGMIAAAEFLDATRREFFEELLAHNLTGRY